MIMSTLFSALVATIAITRGQTYDDCGTASFTLGGESLSMQIERDTENEQVRLTFNGPSDQWYGFVIGSGTMNGYAITVQDTGTDLKERSLANPSRDIITASATPTFPSAGNAVLVRDYAVSGNGYYDFTALMTCQVTEIDLAIAIGADNVPIQYHTSRTRDLSFTSTCTCDTDPGTDATDAPTMADAGNDATDSPSPAPTDGTVDDVTDAPTADDTDDTVVICGTAELITGQFLTVFRDATNKQVTISLQGSSDQWFGYGFGPTADGSGMTGAFGVVLTSGSSTDSADMAVAQYLLDSSNGPGTSLSYGTTTATVSGSTVTGSLTMAYDAAAEFDFTDFLTCQVDSIDLLAAQGSGPNMDVHSLPVGGQTLTRAATCTCSDEPTTTDGANNIFNGFYVIIAAFIGYLLM